MRYGHTIPMLLLLIAFSADAGDQPAPRVVDLKAADGTPLKATYYAAAAPGPAVMLFHMCNTTQKSWAPLAPRLAAAGIHVLTLDYRGFGESGGTRADAMPPEERQKTVREKWPSDVDSAYAFLLEQPGVDKTRIGAGGGSCGVNQAVLFARRHSEVRSLALLAGTTAPDGLRFLAESQWLPVFGAAAEDDGDAVPVMQWLLGLSSNPRNRFSGFKDGKHGTEIFGPHPELVDQIVAWYADTLIRNPADRKQEVTAARSPARDFWEMAMSPDRVSTAVELFHSARKRDPSVVLMPEGALNTLAYQHLQAGGTKQAIALFKLNTEVYGSPNTWDSLGDAYLAAGQHDLALEASEKAIALLATDKANEEFKQRIRASAEEKIAKLKGAAAKKEQRQ